MASNPTATLTSLLRGSSITDHDEILKASNAVLKTSKGNIDASHTRVVALLKLDRFDDALRAMDDGGDKLAERCVLEKAYALYKTGQLSEAAALITSAKGGDERALKHVQAQVAYRDERFEDAATIYSELSRKAGGVDGEENDLRINGLAADAQLEWSGKAMQSREVEREDLEAFETAYNAACGCIARGELEKGAMLLGRARKLCEALDELTDEERTGELLPIMVQQAYVLVRLGKLEEAEKLQEMISTADVPEPPTKLIAQSNALAASTTVTNPYELQRYLESAPKLLQSERLFDYQDSVFRRNRYTIDLKSHKYKGVARSTTKFLANHQLPTLDPSVNHISVLKAAAHTECVVSKSALKHILPELEKRPLNVGLLLTVVQLYALVDNFAAAIEVVDAFFKRLEAANLEEMRFAPGLVALAVSLYRSQGRIGPLRSELSKAASYWRSKPQGAESLLRAAGIELLESGKAVDLEAAREIFSSLHENNPNDRVALAGFVASHAASNPSQVQGEAEKMTDIEKLIADVDIDALLDAGVATRAPVQAVNSKKRSGQDTEMKDAPAPKPKKIRKNKMPKDFVAGKVVDPERWLPVRDRSSYRAPKGKKGKKKANDLTQGGVVKDEEALELVGGSQVKVEKASGGANKKKKGKGKK